MRKLPRGTGSRAAPAPRRPLAARTAASARIALALLLGGLLGGCGGTAEAPEPAPTATGPQGDADPGRGPADPGEYRPGRAATIDLPPGSPEAVVVVVPGGGWSSADPRGFAPLATSLVEEGFAAVTITYGTSGTGDSYPVPVDDVRCAVAYAAAQVAGVPVVVLGHSAGAHLAALAALAPEPPADDCPSPSRAADAVVGLAGPYDVGRVGGYAEDLFGVPQSQDPDAWTQGNPLTWAAERPQVPFLLLHGDQDTVVPVRFSNELAAALTAGGHDVTLEVLAGVDHSTVVAPDVVTSLVVEWVRTTVVG